MYQPAPERIRAILSAAEAKRRNVVKRRVLDAWRLLNGAGDDGPPGLTIDRYGDWLVVAARESLGEELPRAWADAARELFQPRGIVLKTLRPSAHESESELFAGDPAPKPLSIREEDAIILCDLEDGLSTGLFLDLREARLAIRAHAAGVEVLNLFAHTAAFSVHAALAGARRVTSVDVSKKALRRGRENMAASGLDPDRHRWFTDGVLEHLRRQQRRAPAYGLVIADPPVFGRAKGVAFSLERDLEALVEGCIACTTRGGVFVLATHAIALGERRLLDVARNAGGLASREVRVLERLGLPEWDHPPPVHSGEREVVAAVEDRGDYLKTLVLRVG